MLGLPSLHTGHWDPLMRACEETGTVVNLHIGSSGTSPSTSDDAPPDVIGVLFFGYAMFAAVDWLYSKIPVRFPDIKICLSEGGIGWVPALLDRLDHMLSYHEMYGTWTRHRPDAGRGVPAQLLVLRGRRPVGVRDARRHRRRPHPPRVRLPALRLDLARHAGTSSSTRSAACPPTTSARSPGRTLRGCIATPVPEAVQNDPDAY